MNTKLSERQKAEEIYHNEKEKDYSFRKSFGNGQSRYYNLFWELVGEVSGLKVLDFGCGNGWVSVLLAKAGAEVWGIDISGELIRKATKWARDEGLSSRIRFEQMPGEDLTFQENFFDLVLGSAILHHTDIKLAIENISRVLKPGGRGIFVEPLNQNILLRMWRRVTPWRRSPTEKPLVDKDLEFIQSVFPAVEYKFFGFSSVFTEALGTLFPNSKMLRSADNFLGQIDSYLLNSFSFLAKYCAVVVLELKKGM